MAITNKEAWLERQWLEQQWLGANIEDSTFSQVDRFISDATSLRFSQAEMAIEVETPIKDQADRFINNSLGVGTEVDRLIEDVTAQQFFQSEKFIGTSDQTKGQVELKILTSSPSFSQAELKIDTDLAIQSQVELAIADVLLAEMAQSELRIETSTEFKSEVESLIADAIEAIGSQVERQIDVVDLHGSEVFTSDLYWTRCGGWLTQPWVEGRWLIKDICAGAESQVEIAVNTEQAVGSQVQRQIVDVLNGIQTQVERRIDVTVSFFSQANRQFVEEAKCQALISLYNTTRPRVLCEFPSRGITGLNWTATNTKPGDFSILNINNDISEQYWRTSDATTTATISCDTEITQGIFLDTVYWENHNLSSSAVVVMEASNDASFTTISKTENLAVSGTKIFFIEPTLPLASYRYWRFRISDPSNADGFLQVGTVIFGASEILNSECATQDIVVASRDFTNGLPTEGFTSVANSRSLKRSIRLEFQSISYDSGDFTKLDNLINYSRTTLKCLWIPDARSRSLMERFAVFGKLTRMPEQRHNVKGIGENLDFVNFSIEIDEAK